MAGIIALAVLVGSLIGIKLSDVKQEKHDRQEIAARYQVPCDADNCGKLPK